MYIAILGNPGSGKSTLCNCIFKSAIFKSGMSTVNGHSTDIQGYYYDQNTYIDTPGLADSRNMQTANQIESALQKNGYYKIIFVISIQDGRLEEADVRTIKLICCSIRTKFTYSIIVNRLRPASMDLIRNNTKKYIENLPNGLSKMLLLPYMANARNKQNFILNETIRAKVLEFINSVPSYFIPTHEVSLQNVILNQYLEKEMIAKHKENLARYKKELKEAQDEYHNIHSQKAKKFHDIKLLEQQTTNNNYIISIYRSNIQKAEDKAIAGTLGIAVPGTALAFVTVGLSSLAAAAGTAAIAARTTYNNNKRRERIEDLKRQCLYDAKSIKENNNDLLLLENTQDKINKQISEYHKCINDIKRILDCAAPDMQKPNFTLMYLDIINV